MFQFSARWQMAEYAFWGKRYNEYWVDTKWKGIIVSCLGKWDGTIKKMRGWQKQNANNKPPWQDHKKKLVPPGLDWRAWISSANKSIGRKVAMERWKQVSAHRSPQLTGEGNFALKPKGEGSCELSSSFHLPKVGRKEFDTKLEKGGNPKFLFENTFISRHIFFILWCF